MNKIEQLISHYSPNGVEWKMLGEVCDVFTGGEAPSNCIKGDVPNNIFKYPIYGNGAEIYGYTDSYKIDKDAVTISSIGANTGTIYFRKAFFTPIIRLKVVIPKHNNLLPRYLFHYLNSITISSKSSSVPNMNASDVKRILAPIPPLSVQKEIVRILDTFTELTTELTAELTARKKQYDYYQEDFFKFDKIATEWKPLGDIGEFQRGKRFVKNDIISEGVPCIHYGEMYTHYGTWASESKSFLSKELVENKKLRIAERGDVVIVAAGETIEDIGMGTAWLGNNGIVIHDACFSYRSSLNSKYVAYFTRTKHFHDQIKKHISSGKISAINEKGLSKVVIPIPPPEEQERIVAILDKFDTLTTSISEGLPKEIELRKKQYEYYRNILLTFPKDN